MAKSQSVYCCDEISTFTSFQFVIPWFNRYIMDKGGVYLLRVIPVNNEGGVMSRSDIKEIKLSAQLRPRLKPYWTSGMM
ncbi:uncharacterized protein LOC114252551 isoform X3 [Bombyx mandarina]|uniref:Uncharacterized protein LOC114252551 isoform X3 n=1 Tax=Bombyx mandarina TaxID=7092 RepID=A0A6J2KL80_BOMMA|nr:uncharacterized protein LOC114252551 isoform X3 [Bombyx mandarina]